MSVWVAAPLIILSLLALIVGLVIGVPKLVWWTLKKMGIAVALSREEYEAVDAHSQHYGGFYRRTTTVFWPVRLTGHGKIFYMDRREKRFDDYRKVEFVSRTYPTVVRHAMLEEAAKGLSKAERVILGITQGDTPA